MIINYEIIYTDADGNYFRSSTPPGYLPYVFAELRNEKPESFQNSFFCNTKYSCSFSVQPETTLSNILDGYISYLGCDKSKFYMNSSMVYVLCGSDFVNIPEYDFKIQKLFEYYKTPDNLDFFLVFSVLQGDVWREGQIRYFMYSHEAGHHSKPHVHVIINHESSASIDILDARIVAGELPPKYQSKVLKKVSENRKYLLDCWNKQTDGMKVDINYGLGQVTFLKDEYPSDMTC